MGKRWSLAKYLRSRGIVPCRQCHGEGVIKARSPMLEMTAGCGRCDGTGEEPKEGQSPADGPDQKKAGAEMAPEPHERTRP